MKWNLSYGIVHEFSWKFFKISHKILLKIQEKKESRNDLQIYKEKKLRWKLSWKVVWFPREIA